jgi:MSHA pilin protein MshC
MVELTVVIVIVGIVAAIAVPRMVNTAGFASRAFYDSAQALVRHAQKAAIARRASGGPVMVCVYPQNLPTNNFRLAAGLGANCGTLLTDPVTGANLIYEAPQGVTLAPVANFTFDGLGQPNAAATIVITSTIPGDPARQISVAAVTGYVTHLP